MVGNEGEMFQKSCNNDNYLNDEGLDKESNRLAAVGMGENQMGRGGIEPPTHGFSVLYSCYKWCFNKGLERNFELTIRITSSLHVNNKWNL